MSSKIKLVQNDNLPNIEVLLTYADGVPLDLSSPNTHIVVYFRAVGADTPLATLQCTKKTGGTDGRILFNFPGETLAVEPGPYEGEIEVDFAGQKQTIYDVLKFNVRAQFA